MQQPLLVLVTGSRAWGDERLIHAQLDRARMTGRLACVLEGGARGADRIAGLWARACGVERVTMPADWSAHGRRAGVLRNQAMVDWALAARSERGWQPCCLAFPLPGSRGTWDMVGRCRAAGIPVRVVEAGGSISR